ITVIIVFVREAAIGFAFKDIHFVMGPFYRNHVAYASIIALFLPFVYQKSIDPSISKAKRNFLKICLVFLLIALFFSFTRAAILAVVAAIGFIWVIRLKMVRYMVFSVSIAILLGVAYLAKDNRYLEFAPNFDTTIMQDQFGNLINATYQLEDISTMERVYRWVAGFNMIADYPWFGVGPGNFYNAYQSYTITSFKTYVSNNPEHSGIHSYYLMTTVEQGIIGGVLYLLFVFAVFLYGERVFHRLESKEQKNELLAYLLCFFIICILQIINDLIETDKVGPFFWLSVAMIVRAGLSSAKQINTNTDPKIEVQE
ncbi:MAG: O-antigen ligase family protein, partial [Saprospiraceae bacterium]